MCRIGGKALVYWPFWQRAGLRLAAI